MKRSLLLSILALSFLPLLSQTVYDADGNIYDIIPIGTQSWLGQNLRTKRYNNGDPILTTTPANLDISLESNPKYYWAYDGNEVNTSAYGRLYTWYAVVDGRNLCPSGWHVPNNSDWDTLARFLGGWYDAGGKMKESGTGHWTSPNTGATNSSNFSAVPGGHRMSIGPFLSLNTNAFYWSATPNGTDYGWCRKLFYTDAALNSDSVYGFKNYGFSVRCINDTLGTAIERNFPDPGFLFYPNPAKDQLFVKMNSEQNVNIMIYSLNGTCVLEKNINSQNEPVEIHQLKRGLYLVKATSQQHSATQKIIID